MRYKYSKINSPFVKNLEDFTKQLKTNREVHDVEKTDILWLRLMKFSYGALQLWWYIIKLLGEKLPITENEVEIKLSYNKDKCQIPRVSQTMFYKGIKELIDVGFLSKKKNGTYSVNVLFIHDWRNY